ncbi:MAG: septal ring lytic transglycosylase RlpA family protein [Glaciecola sp.]
MQRVYPRQNVLLCLFICMLLQACASNSGRYSIKHDTAPTFDYGEIEYQEVIPRFETYNVWTSRPYQVMGQYYTPLITGKGYEDEGYASWYGQKFHGHKTANGEIFNMFALSAAHKTLPLPSYLQVTNLDNDQSVIVKVNDRGPFHDDRILDLSYGAAKKLGVHEQGVARVKIAVIHVNEQGDTTIGKQATIPANDNTELPSSPPSVLLAATTPPVDTSVLHTNSENVGSQEDLLFVQVMAMQNEEKIKSLALGLTNLLQVNAITPKVANIYRLQLGPVDSKQKANKLIKALRKIGFDQAFTIEGPGEQAPN